MMTDTEAKLFYSTTFFEKLDYTEVVYLIEHLYESHKSTMDEIIRDKICVMCPRDVEDLLKYIFFNCDVSAIVDPIKFDSLTKISETRVFTDKSRKVTLQIECLL